MNIKDELIGETVEVVNNHIKGTILDETKSTFLIKTKEGNKTIIKHANKFKIKNKTIRGEEILKSPENRLKL